MTSSRFGAFQKGISDPKFHICGHVQFLPLLYAILHLELFFHKLLDLIKVHPQNKQQIHNLSHIAMLGVSFLSLIVLNRPVICRDSCRQPPVLVRYSWFQLLQIFM